MVLAGPPAAGAEPAAPPGAASCTGCHAAPGRAAGTIPGVLGRDPEEIVALMREYRAGERPATLMNRIARGFSEEETRAIAAWLGGRR